MYRCLLPKSVWYRIRRMPAEPWSDPLHFFTIHLNTLQTTYPNGKCKQELRLYCVKIFTFHGLSNFELTFPYQLVNCGENRFCNVSPLQSLAGEIIGINFNSNYYKYKLFCILQAQAPLAAIWRDSSLCKFMATWLTQPRQRRKRSFDWLEAVMGVNSNDLNSGLRSDAKCKLNLGWWTETQWWIANVASCCGYSKCSKPRSHNN